MTSRRNALKVIGGMPLAVATVGPVSASSARPDNVSVESWMSDAPLTGYFLEPDTEPVGAVLLIHEWWGLNEQIRSVVPKFQQAGYLSLAVDLYQNEIAENPDRARELMGNIQPDVAIDTLVTWIDWLREHPKSNGKVGTVGWCFGGGWSLNASIATPVDATVIYYGRCAKGVEEVATLSGPVMGHFATQDQFIDRAMVDGFEKSMDAAGKPYQNFWYDADHGFANPTTTRHDAQDSMLAWSRTLDFFDQHLR